MAAVGKQQNLVQNGASGQDLSEDSRKSSTTHRTATVIEKFPSADKPALELKNNLNYLITSSDSNWYMFNPAKRSLTVGSVSDIVNQHQKPSIQEWEVHRGLSFDASHLSVHPDHPDQCILWGKKGMAIIKIPLGSTAVTKTKLDFASVAEDLFVEDVKLETLQVRWHPSPLVGLIAVLFSDQVVRFYDSSNGDLFTGSVSIAAARSTALSFHEDSATESEERSFEDTAVDIDFGPELPKASLWMLFVLLESGELFYVLLRPLEKVQRCYTELHGPVKFNDEGRDPASSPKCTSLIVSKSFPIVIATGDLSNTLKHCVVLPDAGMEENCNLEEGVLSNDLTVYLKEKILLETLCESEAATSVKLIADTNLDSRYVVVTDTGLYLVNMNFLQELRGYLTGAIEGVLRSVPCSVHFLVCWKVSDSGNTGKCLAGVGFCTAVDDRLLVVLGNSKALAINLASLDSTSVLERRFRNDDPESTLTSFPTDGNGQDILNTVTNILKRETTQPFLASNQTLERDQQVKFVCESVETLTKEYIDRQAEAANYLECSVSTLKVKKDTMAENLQELQASRQDLSIKAESIAEQFEECLSRMEDFRKRLDNILKRQKHAIPDLTDEEKKWMAKMNEIQNGIQVYKKWLTNLKELAVQEKSEDRQQTVGRTAFQPGDVQIQDLKKELFGQTESITQLTKQVRELMQLQGLE